MGEWIASLAVSPAQTSALPESRQESTENTPGCGSSTCVLFAKCNPDWSLSKTSLQSSLFQQEEPYSEGLPDAGMMRSGLLYELPKWEPRTAGSERSFWPTSRAEDWESCGNHPGATDSLTGATKNWTTPQAHDMAGGNPNRVRRFGTEHGGANLADDVTLWMTPNCPNGGRNVSAEVVASKGSTPDGKKTVGLESQSRVWATPRTITGGAESAERKQELGRMESGGGDLQAQAQMWGTPTSRDWKDGGSADTAPTNGLLGRQVIQNWPTPDASAINDGESRESWQARADKLKLQHKNGNGAGMPLAIACQSSPPDPAQPNSGLICWCRAPNCAQPSHKRRLNSLFTTWMMGWPLFWLAPEPINSGRAEMASYLSRQRLRLRSLLGE